MIPQGTLHGNKFFVVAGRRWLVAEAGGLTLGFALHLVTADLYEMKTVVGADVSLFRSDTAVQVLSRVRISCPIVACFFSFSARIIVVIGIKWSVETQLQASSDLSQESLFSNFRFDTL